MRVCRYAVYADGKVCISILHPPGTDQFNEQETADERWRPILSVEAVLISICSMLMQKEPNLDSPANIDAAVMFKDTLPKQNLALKATNLLQKVEVNILAADGDDAGSSVGTGKVIGVAEGGGSYMVQVEGGAASAVLPENVTLPTGTVGHVIGLKAEHYNGK